MTVGEYLSVLRERLAGTPRALLPEQPSAVHFVFKQPTGAARATIDLKPTGVEVREGAFVDDDRPHAFVFAKLDDWLAYFEQAERDRLSSIDFYGETALLAFLAGPAAHNPHALRQADDRLGWNTRS
jgi:hypothetical protein